MFEELPLSRMRSVNLVTKVKVEMPADIQGRFDWDAIANNQGNFDFEM